MRGVLFTISIVLLNNNVANGSTKTFRAKLFGKIGVESHRRILFSDLETIINSTHGDDDFSDTIQLSGDEPSKTESRLVDSGSLDVHSDETEDHQDDGGCVVIDECAYCSDLKNDISDQCHITGRRERIECTINNTRKKSEQIRESKYRSCRRTKRDEEFLLMQLQLICVLASYFSLRSVRREKQKSASLFDQRSAKRRSMMTSGNNSPVPYTEIQQGENNRCRDVDIEDNNLIHETSSSEGADKSDNRV